MIYTMFLEEIKKSGFLSSLKEVQTVKFSLPRQYKGFDCAIRLSDANNVSIGEKKLLPNFIKDYTKIGNYINFVFDNIKFSRWCWEIIDCILSNNHQLQEGKIVVEHTSLTPAYPINVATFRGSVIGDALVRGFRHINKSVTADYFVEDTARQLDWIPILFDEGKLASLGSKIDHCYGRYFAEQCKKNKNIELTLDEIKSMFPYGDYNHDNPCLSKTSDKQQVGNCCLKGNLETLSKAGIKFDSFHYESCIIGNDKKDISYIEKNAEFYKSLISVSNSVYTVVPRDQSVKIVEAIRYYNLSKIIKPICFGKVLFTENGQQKTDKISQGRFHSIDAFVNELGEYYHISRNAAFNSIKILLLKENYLENVVFHSLGDEQYQYYLKLNARLKEIHEWINHETDERFGDEIYSLSKKSLIAYNKYTKDILDNAKFDSWIDCLSSIVDCFVRCKEKGQFDQSIMNSAFSFLKWGYAIVGIEFENI